VKIEDIKLFIEITRRHNISMTARNMFMSQATVSRRLALLEDELNIRLFFRGKGQDSVALTPAGERFLPLAEQMAVLAEEAYSLQKGGTIRTLSIAMPDSIASYALKGFFFSLSRQNPAWDFEIALHDSVQICGMVANHIMDIGLSNEEVYLPELRFRLMYQENYVVLRRGEAWASTAPIHPSELKASHEIQQIICPEHQFWHDQWWSSGYAKCRVNHARFTAGFLNEPDDWAVLPESVARELRPEDGYIRYLTDPPPPRRCFFVTHKKARPNKAETIEDFLVQLEDFITEQKLDRC